MDILQLCAAMVEVSLEVIEGGDDVRGPVGDAEMAQGVGGQREVGRHRGDELVFSGFLLPAVGVGEIEDSEAAASHLLAGSLERVEHGAVAGERGNVPGGE